MPAARTLQPDQRIAHFRVVGPLGSGGMGEVYLAQDLTLERSVAIKILPPELTRVAERVRRFVQEAKAASSLNHPNIVTIYEIGEAPVTSPAGEAEGAPLPYIAMERVAGRTLGAHIHEDRTDLRTLIGWIAQAAEGVAKAHGAGIVHRDLKPGNIMVSDDGFAKVLDFGLAKLLERRETESRETSAPTDVGERTSDGALLGTAGYMAPEQVLGKAVDHRADVFALGCILYEAATRRQPFAAEHRVEVLHRILNDKPAPIEEIAPGVPAELRRLIRRCLAKNPDQRVQSMKDVAIELREIADEFDTLSASASSGSSASAAPAPAARRGLPAAVLAAAAVVTIAALAFGWYESQRAKRAGREGPPQTLRAWPQTSSGNVAECALSRDGRYLAYITLVAGRWALHVRQVTSGGDVEVLPPSTARLEFVSFSPDGEYVLYCRRDAQEANYRTLFQAPSIGGPERERAFDVDSRVSFSPDGRRICFSRHESRTGQSTVVITELETRKERALAIVRRPTTLSGPPAWSPDGRHIAVFEVLPAASMLAVYDVASGARREVMRRPAAFYYDVAWLPGGDELAVVGDEPRASISNQVYLVGFRDGRVRRVTNDANDYGSVTVSADTALAVVRASTVSNVWLADAVTGAARPLTSVTTVEDSPFDVATADDGSVVYDSMQDQTLGLWYLPPSGGAPRRVPTGEGWALNPSLVGDRVLFLGMDLKGGGHVFQVAPDGERLRQLTQGRAENLIDVSPRGGYFLYAVMDSARGVWSMPVDGGPARLIAPEGSPSGACVSPDGTLIAAAEFESAPDGMARPVIRVHPARGGPVVASLHLPGASTGTIWRLGDDALYYCDFADSSHNIVRLPLSGGAPAPVTAFREGIVNGFRCSPDGRRLAVRRRIGARASLWLVDADGGHPLEIRGIEPPDIFRFTWTPDGRHLALSAGTESDDAFILRDFR